MKQIKQSIQNILILGDSYSTFEGHIPEGFATHFMLHFTLYSGTVSSITSVFSPLTVV